MRNRKNTLKASELTERFMLHEMCVCVWGGGDQDSGSGPVLQSNESRTNLFAYPFPD